MKKDTSAQETEMITNKKSEASTDSNDKTNKQETTVLDLAFIMDCTGSMGPYIHNATQSIKKICEEITETEKSNIKLALVEYRDHPPEEMTFVTNTHDFTESVDEMKKWLEACRPIGGGDLPEAVADGLNEAYGLNWRKESTKICVLISDAPPHGLMPQGDSLPNGCPKGIDPLNVVKEMSKKGITLYCVGCEPAISRFKDFFSALAFITGGQYVPLRNAKLLSKVIVGGAVEEISLEKLMEEVQLDVDDQRSKGINDEAVLSEFVTQKLKSRGTRTRQLQFNGSQIERPTTDAISYSKSSNMTKLRETFTANSKRVSMPSKDPPTDFLSPREHSSSDIDSYNVLDSEIQEEQVERMVQKAMQRSSNF